MSNTSRRVVISCALISAAIILCVGIIGVAGITIYSFYPPATSEEQIIAPTAPPLPTEPGQPGEPVPSPTLDPGTEIPGTEQIPVDPTPEAGLPEDITDQMDEIQVQVAELRGLEPLQPVDRFLLSPDQLRTRVIEDFLEDYNTQEAQDEAQVWAAFGMLDPAFDLYNFYVDLLTEQIVGFYDSDTKEMYIIQGVGFAGPERLTYAHEFVHALQDQHYQIEEGLGYNDEDCEQNIDYCAAVSALLEGDASLLELQWLFNHASQQDIRDIQDFYQTYESPYFDNAPSFMREDLIFPYRAGQEFVEQIYERSGWEGVDQVYADPPRSTEQILHPERYPDVLPVVVDLPDLQETLGEGWRELERSLWGEWYTYLFLAEGLAENTRISPEEAQIAADGWAGDAYAVFYNEDGGQYVLVLQTQWKNEAEALEFTETFLGYADARFGSQKKSEASSWTWESAEETSLFELDGNVTTWIITPGEELLNQIRERIVSP